MKNTSFLPAIFALCTLVFSFESCKDNCGNDINAVQPNSNPSGYEVLLKTSGFANTAKVVFGTVEATSRPGSQAGEIIARVPTGLSGNVEISVDEGDCIARSGDFIVSGALPGNVQPSLPDIILPTAATVFPTGFVTNAWVNAARTNPANSIYLQGTLISGVCQLDPASQEFDTDPYFNNNPVSGTVNTNTNVIYLEIDRIAKGGIVEKFDGLFIANPSIAPSDVLYTILLISRETGRQLLLYFK